MLELLLKTKSPQELSLKGAPSESGDLKNGEKSDFFSMLLSIKDAKTSKKSVSLDTLKSLDPKESIPKELISKLGSSKDKVKFMLLEEKDVKPKEMTLKELFKIAKSKDLNLEKIEIVSDKKDPKGEIKEAKTTFDKNSIRDALEKNPKQKDVEVPTKKAFNTHGQNLSKDEVKIPKDSALKTLLSEANIDKKPAPKTTQAQQADLKNTLAQESKKEDTKDIKTSKATKVAEPSADIKSNTNKESESLHAKTKTEAKPTTEAMKNSPKLDPETKVEPKEIPKADTKVEAKVDTKAEAKVDPKTDVKAEPKVEQKIDTKEAQTLDKKESNPKESAKANTIDNPLKSEQVEKKDDVKKVDTKNIETEPKENQKRATNEQASKVDHREKTQEVKNEDRKLDTPKVASTETKKAQEDTATKNKKDYFENSEVKEDRYAKAKEDDKTTRVAQDERSKIISPSEPRQMQQQQKNDDNIKTSKEPSFLEKLFAKSGEFGSDSESSRENKDDKHQESNSKSFVKEDSNDKSGTISASRFDILSKSLNAKDTLRNLAANLQREAQNYKPPFKKITLELNPAKLGNVEVTMVTRGKNLHINIGSNTQAIALLSQNMVDFRNALNEIGFGEVSMNFNSSDKGDSDQGQHDGRKDEQRGNNNSLYTSSNSEEASESLEIVLPRYM